ncbi:insulinoma-associated protein 2 [Gouania willdenowi]|uniref:insulinoma-associated protein 2 n=1 Tax=Gouania willdenowi TaxID=441366 RepID=UPI00105554BB|nr:insulinoma-associated protein 2-like [Gouania willdenowi]
MPRGFLVKRHRRGAASYRTRSDSEPDRSTGDGSVADSSLSLPRLSDGEFPVTREDTAGVRDAWSPHVESALEAEAEQRAQLPEAEVESWSPAGDFSRFFPPHELMMTGSCSPVNPVGTSRLAQDGGGPQPPELPDLPFHLSFTPASVTDYTTTYGHEPSPAHVSLFAPLTVMNQKQLHAARSHALMEAEQRVNGNRIPKGTAGNAPKKLKVNRKLNFEDEVTTSPVLGLRIKKESPEQRRRREKPSGTGNQPLGEFICQLCKEQYRDPFSLAQHKCSRIVRVEYRCPECDKVFSCPANLASHRRWHKPRPVSGQTAGEVPPHKSPSLKGARDHVQHGRSPVETEGKENDQHRPLLVPYWTPVENCADLEQHVRAADSPPSGRVLLNGSPAEPPLQHPSLPFALTDEEVYDCRYCGKKFRRQAYLKKHLSAHESSASAQSRAVFLCHLCGARFPSVEIRDKHRLWHAELLAETLGGGAVFHALTGEREQQQIFTCKHCPSTFFSSPGLTKHVQKSHPSEERQVMLLQMTVTP